MNYVRIITCKNGTANENVEVNGDISMRARNMNMQYKNKKCLQCLTASVNTEVTLVILKTHSCKCKRDTNTQCEEKQYSKHQHVYSGIIITCDARQGYVQCTYVKLKTKH